MKRFSSYVDKKVYETNKKITNLQNKTKELFFYCLDKGEDVEYFQRELDKIWDKVDYSFMQDDIDEYIEMIHTYNLEQANVKEEDLEGQIDNTSPNKTIYLMALGLILTQVDRFKEYTNWFYELSYNSSAYKEDKKKYLKLKVQKYNSQTVPYYSKTKKRLLFFRKPVRHVKLSTYTAMVENTNLTISGWNKTLKDADLLGKNEFIIPYHLFSCPECAKYQDRILTREQIKEYFGLDGEQYGEIIHPNCKCNLLIWWGQKIGGDYNFTDEQKDEFYYIRQKTNALTLRKSELLSDRRIYRNLGEQDEIDEINKKIRSINTKIKDLQAQLPTEEMKKEVVAINR